MGGRALGHRLLGARNTRVSSAFRHTSDGRYWVRRLQHTLLPASRPQYRCWFEMRAICSCGEVTCSDACIHCLLTSPLCCLNVQVVVHVKPSLEAQHGSSRRGPEHTTTLSQRAPF